MLTKILITAVAALVLLAALSRLGGRARGRAPGPEDAQAVAARCADCGRPVRGTAPCLCQGGRP